MKKYLLPKNGSFYKANLHCHSTVSDGRWTPEEIKKNYKEAGYSVVAYTDHSAFVLHNELTDESFLAMNGYELDFGEKRLDPSSTKSTKTCHVCFVSLDKNKKTQRLFYKNKFIDEHIDEVCLDGERDYLDREYSSEYISDIIRQGREDNFFVTYNHPIWSLETRDEYCNYHGMHAMEVVNYGCVALGYDDRNGNIYDEMLRNGEKIFCIATDDNHNIYPMTDPKCDSFGGFTMIKAEKLTYEDISAALLNGDFYSSEGPEIKELYFEDGKIYIETSAAAKIIMNPENRIVKLATAEVKGETINRACFDISSKMGDYVRFTVVDEKGLQAYTNAFFLSSFNSAD